MFKGYEVGSETVMVEDAWVCHVGCYHGGW